MGRAEEPTKNREREATFSATLERSTNRLWGAHVRVPAKVAQAYAGQRARRVVCTIGGSDELQRALLPLGEGAYAIAVNTALRTSLGLTIGDTVRVRLWPDRSTYGLPVPEELTEAFRQDPAGSRLFHALPPGKQRTLLYIVASARNPVRRAERAVIILRHLESTGGTLIYRKLNALLKVRASQHR